MTCGQTEKAEAERKANHVGLVEAKKEVARHFDGDYRGEAGPPR